MNIASDEKYVFMVYNHINGDPCLCLLCESIGKQRNVRKLSYTYIRILKI